MRIAACTVVLLLVATPATARRLSEETAASGLREALVVGTEGAVEALGRPDGFWKSPEKDVRIEVPGDLRHVAALVRGVGRGDLVDEFELSMNRAAEAAVPLAKRAFIDAIKEMRFKDVWNVLTGGKHAATEYLREHAGPKLAQSFRPIVQEKLQLVGATRDFEELMDRTRALPLLGGKPLFELDEYVTDEALDGLFRMVEREEEAIRRSPIKRGTALLRKVFGSKEARSAVTP